MRLQLQRRDGLLVTCAATLFVMLSFGVASWASDEITPGTGVTHSSGATVPRQLALEVPMPDPLVTIPDAPAQPDESIPSLPDDSVPEAPVEIRYDVDSLPEPVQRMRKLIMDAARTGDLENLRPLIGTGESMTTLSFGDVSTDPIEYLRAAAGDLDGQEILAILLEIMEAGFVHVDPGQPTELYVWPYFFSLPIEELKPRQKVELFKLITAGDYEDMRSFGAYIFYRSGIAPDGSWVFFVAGD